MKKVQIPAEEIFIEKMRIEQNIKNEMLSLSDKEIDEFLLRIKKRKR